MSFVSKSLAFEWMVAGLQQRGYNLAFVLLHQEETDFELFLRSKDVTVYRVSYRGKPDLPAALFSVFRILRKYRTGIVHCHLFDACIIGLPVAWALGIRKRIYTRHNSTLHHVYFPRAVYYDKFINTVATTILAISERVKKVLIEDERVLEKKIFLLHHGFDLTQFEKVSEEKVTDLFRRYKLDQNRGPVIGVVSRYMHWKGIQYIIPAFAELLKSYPQAVLVLANASGPYKSEIKQLLEALPHDNVREIEFESEILALFKTFDVFVHVPIDDHSEAFGQVYIESLASGVPSVITLSGIAHEYARNGENAIVIDYKNSIQIHEGICTLLREKDLRNRIVANGLAVSRNFSIEQMVEKLDNIYRL